MIQHKPYLHTDISITTITGLLNSKNGIAEFFKDKREQFFSFKGDTDESNLDRIYKMYTEEDKKTYPSKDTSIELLKPSTILIIPIDNIQREILSISGRDQFLEQKNFDSFYGDSLVKMLKDPNYFSSFKLRHGENQSFTAIHPYLSVWIYSGSLNKIINVTNFVINCNTSVSKSCGNFTIVLPPIIDIDNLKYFNDDVLSLNNIGGKEFYFHKHIQVNDVVFIKFEKLKMEKDIDNLVNNRFFISKSMLAGQIFDMVGLVDSNSKSVSYDGNEVSITVSGRDFMKLFLDDGSYFMPLQFVENSESLFLNLNDNDKLIKRVFFSGEYKSLFAFSMRDIKSSVQYIINQLSNLGIVDESVDLFASYGARRSKVYRLAGYDEYSMAERFHNGVWQIVKLLVDENLDDRRVVDSSISMPEGSLINQVQKLCQEPFVEFFGDTYGDTYNLIMRQPPFTKSQIISSKDNTVVYQKDSGKYGMTDLILTIDGGDVLNENITWEDQSMYYSWYELTPQGSFIGSASSVSLAYIPIVYLPEYADKWGLKKFSVVSNYISYKALTGVNSDINADQTKQAIINDYKFMIDSYSYLPFTRKGTLILNGDRRFKRGTWVRYRDEIFYIDSVMNDFSVSGSIERTTVLNISRGMVEKYVSGANSYFDIVNSDLIKEVLIRQLTTGGVTSNKPSVNIKSNFLVNKTLFNFFYSRNQFK